MKGPGTTLELKLLSSQYAVIRYIVNSMGVLSYYSHFLCFSDRSVLAVVYRLLRRIRNDNNRLRIDNTRNGRGCKIIV